MVSICTILYLWDVIFRSCWISLYHTRYKCSHRCVILASEVFLWSLPRSFCRGNLSNAGLYKDCQDAWGQKLVRRRVLPGLLFPVKCSAYTVLRYYLQGFSSLPGGDHSKGLCDPKLQYSAAFSGGSLHPQGDLCRGFLGHVVNNSSF